MTTDSSTLCMGVAGSEPWQRYGLSYVREPGERGGPSTAIADAWPPPSPMALPREVCVRLREFALTRCRAQTHDDSPIGAPTTRPGVTAWVLGSARVREDAPQRHRIVSGLEPSVSLPVDLMVAVVARIQQANATWWTFDLDSFTLIVKRYTAGGDHATHMDWMPDPESQDRKLSSSLQLSDTSEYEGGDLKIRRANGGPNFFPITMPRALGTVVVFPSWTLHEVTPVTAGERWVLLVNGWGPRLR